MVHTLLPFTSRFPQFFDEAFLRLNGGEAKEWFTPTIDVAEADEGFEISLDLPGRKGR